MAPIGGVKLLNPADVVAQELGLPLEGQTYELYYDRDSITLRSVIKVHCSETPDPNVWGGCNLTVTLTREEDGKVKIFIPKQVCLHWTSIHARFGLSGPGGEELLTYLEQPGTRGDCTPRGFVFTWPNEQAANALLIGVLRAMGGDIPVPDTLRFTVDRLQRKVVAADVATFIEGEKVSWVDGAGVWEGTSEPKERGDGISYSKVPPSGHGKVHNRGTVTSDGEYGNREPLEDIQVVDDATGRPYIVPRGELTKLPQSELGAASSK